MSMAAVVRSTLRTALTRYSYSRGLWLLLLIAPIGARYMVAQDDGTGLQVAIGGHLPVMTSATLGVTLGIIVSTLLLPVGFLYLRSNVTRIQPWQIEEVTPASRVAIALGRFGADVAVLFAVLAALTVAGWFLGWLVGSGPLNIGHIALTLWVVAAPSLMMLAAIRTFVDSLRFTRGGWGETLFFIAWLTMISVPAVLSSLPSSYAVNMLDMTGFVRPLTGPQPLAMGDFSIGVTRILPGRVPLDAMAGLVAPGYLASRVTWAALAVALAALSGLIHAPHIARPKPSRPGLFTRLLAFRPAAPATPSTMPAGISAHPLIGLLKAEFRLIGDGRAFLVLAAGAALLGLLGDYRHIGSPAALLPLIFGLVAHASRSERLHTLGGVAMLAPMSRRIAFVMAGTAWAVVMALPAAITQFSAAPLLLALGTGLVAALVAATLTGFSRSAFAPRLILLLLWYGYFAS